MSIYLIGSKNDIQEIELFRKIEKNFKYINYEVKLFEIERCPEFATIIKSENTIDNNIIIISNYNYDLQELYNSNLNIYYILGHMPTNITTPGFYSLIPYEFEKVQYMTKLTDGFYYKDNQIMILPGSSLTPNEFIYNNNLYFSRNQAISSDFILHNIFTSVDERVAFKAWCRENDIETRNTSDTGIKLNQGVYVLYNTENIDEVFDILSYDNIVITTSAVAKLIFGDNLCYINNMSEFGEKFMTFDFSDQKKMNINNLIYDKYMLYQRCNDLINFLEMDNA